MILTNESVAAPDRSNACSIQFAAESRLRASPYLELHNLHCIYRAGILTVMGCVSRYYLWQVALSLVQQLEGVDMVDNQVAVVDGRRAPQRVAVRSRQGEFLEVLRVYPKSSSCHKPF